MATRHVVWDWNGTLLDDLSLVVACTNAVFASIGGRAVTADEHRVRFRRPVADYYAEILGQAVDEEAYGRLDRIFHEAYRAGLTTCELAGDARDPWGFRIADLARYEAARLRLRAGPTAGTEDVRKLVEDLLAETWVVGSAGEGTIARRALKLVSATPIPAWAAEANDRVTDRRHLLFWAERLLPEGGSGENEERGGDRERASRHEPSVRAAKPTTFGRSQSSWRSSASWKPSSQLPISSTCWPSAST